MKDIHVVLAATTSIVLFIFGLEGFSKEIQRITGERFRKFLGNSTRHSGLGVLLGAVLTALIQSSSATSVIAISLVNAGVLSFKNSIGIIIGSNIGTTLTAQLVAFKLTSFAPIFIILGFVLSFIRTKYSIFAKSMFYFGFVFFSLNLISSALAPLQADQRLIAFLTQPQSPFIGVLAGSLVTALVQSSSVTTGLAIILTQQGIMGLENAMPVLMGANIGTTFTALISIFNMDIAAKKTALAHFLFNLGGVLLFLPVVMLWKGNFPLLASTPAVALANFHLIFNLVTSLLFMLALKPFTALIDKILGEGKMDFERLDLSFMGRLTTYPELEKELRNRRDQTYLFVQENYNLVTLSIETNYKGVYEAAKKRIAYLDFVKSEFLGFFSKFIGHCESEEEMNALVKIMGVYEYIFQIQDSVKDITGIKDSMDRHYIELKSDLLLIVREISSQTLSFFRLASDVEEKEEFEQKMYQFQENLDEFNKSILKMMSRPERRDAATILHLMTYSQRLKDKLVNYHKLVHEA